MAAAAQIGRCLLNADQLVPLLPEAETAIPAALGALAADVGRVAQSVRHGAAAPRLAGRDPHGPVLGERGRQRTGQAGSR